jgi:hypothetical protein
LPDRKDMAVDVQFHANVGGVPAIVVIGSAHERPR